MKYSVENKSNVTMPFSIGAHPAFTIEDSFSDYSLQFNEAEEFVSYELENEQFNNSYRKIHSENGQINLNYSHFEKDALVFKHLKSNNLTLLKKKQPFLYLLKILSLFCNMTPHSFFYLILFYKTIIS